MTDKIDSIDDLVEIIHLQDRLGYKWRDRDLLLEAITHSSYGNEHNLPHNELLEFLGDSVLDLISAEYLMAKFPGQREGHLSQARSEMVRTCALAQRARDLGINSILRVGRRAEYLRSVESVLADSMEAVIGAAYRDSGDINVVRELALKWGILR